MFLLLCGREQRFLHLFEKRGGNLLQLAQVHVPAEHGRGLAAHLLRRIPLHDADEGAGHSGVVALPQHADGVQPHLLIRVVQHGAGKVNHRDQCIVRAEFFEVLHELVLARNGHLRPGGLECFDIAGFKVGEVFQIAVREGGAGIQQRIHDA